jgi:hypothetical protein
MRAWEEARDSGELDSHGSGSEDEDELTVIKLLRDLDPPAPRPPVGTAPVAQPGQFEWPKKVLQQTNLVSSIAAEIELNINRADWDADCYEGCRRLLLRETQRMGAVSDDRGPEEIPVLMDFEDQHWVAEALENATRATELILGRVASMGMHCPNLDQQEAGDLDPAASRATQAVMRAATAYPLSDAQLERIVKLALGKRVLAAPAAMAGGNPPPRRQLRRLGPPATIRPSRKWYLRARVRVTPRTALDQRDHRLQEAWCGPPHQGGRRQWP